MYLLRQAIKPSRSFCNFILITSTMKKIFLSIICVMGAMTSAFAQDAQAAAAEAAATISEAPEVEPEVAKPVYWTNSLKTNLTTGQTSLTNWAAGGDNTVSVAAFIDGNANWQKDDMFWNNRLQLDYGFLYASSKPILQKSSDRIYLESKWGYKTESMKNMYFSANYDFKSQFSSGYDYKTPGSVTDDYGNELTGSALKDRWREARVLKSNFLAPAYTNLALGLDYKPAKWFSMNFAPLTGGFVIVKDGELRTAYSMGLRNGATAEQEAEAQTALDNAIAGGNAQDILKAEESLYSLYRSAKFEFGAQLKMDAKVNINDNFSYTTQCVLFANYLDIAHCPRINWDNRIDWKIAKYFSLTFTTNLIYDDTIMITNPKDIEAFPAGKARVQFKESLAFGFTYTIATKKD